MKRAEITELKTTTIQTDKIKHLRIRNTIQQKYRNMI